MAKLFTIDDQHTVIWFGKFYVSNRFICAVLGFIQLFITGLSGWQHIYSILHYGKVLECRFNGTFQYATLNGFLTGSDIIIFDYGLFHELLGTSECVANFCKNSIFILKTKKSKNFQLKKKIFSIKKYKKG